MRSFKELQELSQNFLQENLNDLEKTVSLFLMDQEVDLEIIKENLDAFLDYYVYPETVELAKKVLDRNYLEIFLSHEKPEVNQIALDYIRESDEFNDFEGLLDPSSLIFSCQKQEDLLILNQAPEVFSQDLQEFLEEAKELKETPTKIKAKLKKVVNQEGFSFVLTLSSPKGKEEVRRKNLMSKLKKPIQTGVMALAIFSGAEAFAGDGKEALKQASKAALETKEGKMLKSYAKEQAKKIEKIVKESGGEIPAMIVGYGAKVAMERKIGVGYKVSEEGNVRIDLESNFQDASVRFSGDGPNFLENSRYQFNAGTSNGAGEFKFQLGFEF